MTIACLVYFAHFGKRAGWFARFIEFSRLTEDACVAIFVVVHVCMCVCVCDI